MGLNMARLLENYWQRQRIFPKVGKCLGTSFGTGRRVTQGDPEYPMIFNTVVDAVVREVLEKVCSPQEDQNGMGRESGERNLVFNADEGRILGQYHEWVPGALIVTITTFVR